MNRLALIALVIVSLPVSAQPTSGPSADAPPVYENVASVTLDASLEAVVHYGTAVLLWDALPSADGYVVQAGPLGGAFVEVTRISADAATDAVGYSVRLDLPDGQYAVRLVASGTAAASSLRDLTVEAPGAFDAEEEGPQGLLATN